MTDIPCQTTANKHLIKNVWNQWHIGKICNAKFWNFDILKTTIRLLGKKVVDVLKTEMALFHPCEGRLTRHFSLQILSH